MGHDGGNMLDCSSRHRRLRAAQQGRQHVPSLSDALIAGWGRQMYGRQVTARELQRYWAEVGSLGPGQEFGNIELWHMPPWDDLCANLQWELHLVGDGYFGKKEYGFRGVYRLIGLAAEGDLNKPITFNRVCGHDTTGTLYIGKTVSLSNRANQLQRSILDGGGLSPHNAAYNLATIPVLNAIVKRFAIALLSTDVGPVDVDSRLVEKDLLKAYMNSFGDTPPLNYSLRR